MGKRLIVEAHIERYGLAVDEILVGAGRSPNVEGLGLENAGVDYDASGVKVNARLRTTNPRIFAAGDVCSRHKFTHAADAMAQIVIQNALFPHPFGLGLASVDSLFSVLMKAGAGARTLSSTVHPSPTQSEVNKKVATLWRKARFSEAQKRILKKWFSFTR